MQAEPALHPERRTLYAQSLRPPPGYVFDGGVATTYSMDFDTALAVPVGLTLSAAEDRDVLLSQPLALLEGAQRVAKSLLVFTDAGRIHASSQPQSRLCSLLEGCVVEVLAPNGGAFHPKFWVLRFKPGEGDGAIRLRLLILSRNLTSDRSWDIGLILDGEVGGRPHASNNPLSRLVAKLPSLALSPLSEDQVTWVQEISEQLRCSTWVTPNSFEKVSFAVNGLGGKQWRPEAASKLGIISPFLDETTLLELSDLPRNERPWLISRSDQLASISEATLKKYEHVMVLHDGATTDDTDDSPPTALEGLHAKIYVAEKGWDTSVTVGSGNATCAGLEGSNVEVFATLTGKRVKVGSVAKNLGPDGFGKLARPFVPGEVLAVDGAIRAGELRLRAMHRALCKAGLRLRCDRADNTNAGLWRLTLVPPGPWRLDHNATLDAWPITVSDSHARPAAEYLAEGRPVVLASLACADLTAFVAYRLVDIESGQSIIFSSKLPIEGLPAERDGEVLRSVIKDRIAFFGYLRLLLSDAAELAVSGQSLTKRLSAGAQGSAGADDVPMLEDLVRALCRGEHRALKAIDELMCRLDSHPFEGEDPVPEGFRELWTAFCDARCTLEASHGA